MSVQRNASRFDFGGSDLPVSVFRTDIQSRQVSAVPLDVSCTGVKLQLGVLLLVHEPIEVEFHSGNAKLSFRVSGQVRWIRNVKKDSLWVVGCALDEELSAEQIQSLSKGGVNDRRNSSRAELNVAVEGQLQTQHKRLPVTLLDVSELGVKISTPHKLDEDERLKLFIKQATGEVEEVLVTVQWVERENDLYVAGCEVTPSFLPKFRRTCKQFVQKTEATQKSCKPLLMYVLSAAIVSLALAWCVWF